MAEAAAAKAATKKTHTDAKPLLKQHLPQREPTDATHPSSSAASEVGAHTDDSSSVARATRASARARAAAKSVSSPSKTTTVRQSGGDATTTATVGRRAVPPLAADGLTRRFVFGNAQSEFDPKIPSSLKKSASPVQLTRQHGLKNRHVNSRGLQQQQQQQHQRLVITLPPRTKHDTSCAQSKLSRGQLSGSLAKRPRSIGRLTPPTSAASSPKHGLLPPLGSLVPFRYNNLSDDGLSRATKRARLSSTSVSSNGRENVGAAYALPLPLNLPSPAAGARQ